MRKTEQVSYARSYEGPTLKTSACESLYGGQPNSHYQSQLIKPSYLANNHTKMLKTEQKSFHSLEKLMQRF